MKRLVKKEIGDERLGRKDVMIKVVGYVGKDKETVRLLPDFRLAFPSCNAFLLHPSQGQLGRSLTKLMVPKNRFTVSICFLEGWLRKVLY